MSYINKVLGYSPIAYWPLNEASGTTANCYVDSNQDGTYSSDVSTWPTGPGIGDGSTAPQADGTNDYVDVYSATLASVFDTELGSLICWVRVANSGVWTDGNWRNPFRIGADADNCIQSYKLPNGGADNLAKEVMRGGTWNGAPTTTTTTDWFFLGITWDKSGNQTAYHFNTTRGTYACGGSWSGALNSAHCVLGASTTSTGRWHGSYAHFAIFDYVLSQAELEDLAEVEG